MVVNKDSERIKGNYVTANKQQKVQLLKRKSNM